MELCEGFQIAMENLSKLLRQINSECFMSKNKQKKNEIKNLKFYSRLSRKAEKERQLRSGPGSTKLAKSMRQRL